VTRVPGAVRRAGAADAPDVAALWRALVEAHGALDPAFRLRACASETFDVAARRWLARDDAAFWIFREAACARGFCAARVERAPEPLAEPARAEITDLWVDAAARRQGIGRALFGAAAGWARARGSRRLEVRVAARNAEAQGFWRAIGFADFVDVLDLRL
jgi:ribosomal protein S18 acetylase RimI-like enzyme